MDITQLTFATKVLKDLGYDQCDQSDKKKLPNVYKSCPICIQNGSERRFQTFRRSRRRRRSHCRWRWRHLLNFYFLHKNDFFCDEIWRPYSHELSQSEKVWPDSTVICLIFGNFQQWKFAQQYKSLLNLVEILTNYYLNLPSRNRLRLLKNSQNGKILPNLVPLIRSCVGIGGGKTDLKTF